MDNERFIFWFWESPTTGWHACNVKKTLSLSYNIHLFWTYLLKDSQTIHSTIHFSKPILCVTLICGDWSDWSHFHFIMPVMPDKAAFVSAVLLCVQRYRGNSNFYHSKSSTWWQRMNLHFHSDQCENTNKWAGNMLMFHFDVNMKRLGIRFKKMTRFNDSESTLSFKRQ